MTPFHFDTIESSARLVAFGLTPGLKPAREPAYAQLIERYRTDSAMRHCTDAVARGLHLAVLGFTPQGIVLGADEDGPFVHRLTDYRRTTLSVEDRMCHGLVQLAIAAWCFPTAQDLAASDDSAGVRFSTNKVVAYVVRLSEELHDVWHVFRGALAIEYSDRGREALAGYLTALRDQGHLQFPQQRGLWDLTPAPPLPRWVQLAASAPGGPPIDHRSIAWPPELARLIDEPRIAPDMLADLLAIQRFLAEGGRRRELVPLRERSVELLGDEKRLDVLVRSRLAMRVGLGPELLRVRPVPVPIVWEPGPSSDATTILVIENLHTYDSFRRWNAREGAHLAVVYGAGKAFAGMLDDLGRIVVELGAYEIHYFGDLDAEGLQIPASAARVLGALPLVPAEQWYEMLLDRGVSRSLPDVEPTAPESGLQWLPDRLRPRVKQLLVTGRRLPQELIGWDQLRDISRQSESGQP